MPSKRYFFLLCVAIIFAPCGFYYLLNQGVVHRFGQVIREQPSLQNAILCLSWYAITGLLFLACFIVGCIEIRTTPVQYQRKKAKIVLVSLVDAILVSSWITFFESGFWTKYIAPLFRPNAPEATMWVGIPFLVISVLLCALTTYVGFESVKFKKV